MNPVRVYLLGFMGAGKTTVGKILSERLGWPFLDLDEEIEEGVGMPIPAIFRKRGEASFRQLELKYLDRASRSNESVVVACGGGLPLSARNRRMMERTGLSVYLSISPETAIKRVGEDPHRPLFEDPAQVRALWERRQSAYDEIPNSVDADNKSLDEVVDAVLDLIEQEGD